MNKIRFYKLYGILGLILGLAYVSCSLTSKIKNGESAFERTKYAIATIMLEEEFENSQNYAKKSHKAFQLGVSHDFLGNITQAHQWFEIAYNLGYGNQAALALAKVSKKLGKYAQSKNCYKVLNNEAKDDYRFKRELAILENIEHFHGNHELFDIKPIKVNSEDAEYSMIPYGKDYLLFTSDNPKSSGNEIYNWFGSKYSDIFIVARNGSIAESFSSTINTTHNEGTPTFNDQETEIFFTRCYSFEDSKEKDDYCKIMFSYLEEGSWSKPEVLSFIAEGFNYGHPTLIENDSVLVFSADLPSSLGEKDLYYSVKIAKNIDNQYEWTDPLPLPNTINTPGNEVFPVGMGDTLYFSSDYHPGLGGLDIFKTHLSDGKWTTPVNMKSPINSSFDDFGYIVDKKAKLRSNEIKKGFFSSNRNSYQYENIFSFTKIVKDKIVASIPPLQIDTNKYIINLIVQILEPVYRVKGDPNADKTGNSPIHKADVLIRSRNTSNKRYTTDENGYVILELTREDSYEIVASKNGYFTSSALLSTIDLTYPENKYSISINKKLYLDKIYYDQEIVFDNIYYEFDKWNIREDAKPTLDSFVQLLHFNPTLNIELSSHTDCIGDNQYNIILSQKRAQSVVDYISEKGINANRLFAKGYGELLPMVDCECDKCSTDDLQKNRRTSFKILRPD